MLALHLDEIRWRNDFDALALTKLEDPPSRNDEFRHENWRAQAQLFSSRPGFVPSAKENARSTPA